MNTGLSVDVPVNHGYLGRIVLVRQYSMDELPVWCQASASGDKVDLAAVERGSGIEMFAAHLAEVMILSVDSEVTFAFVNDTSFRATHVHLFPLIRPKLARSRTRRLISTTRLLPCNRDNWRSVRLEDMVLRLWGNTS